MVNQMSAERASANEFKKQPRRKKKASPVKTAFNLLLLGAIVTIGVGLALPATPVGGVVKTASDKIGLNHAFWLKMGLARDPIDPAIAEKDATRVVADTNKPWDGLVRLTPAQIAGIGVQTTLVQKQTQPVKLELPGTTAYDPDTLTKIRTRFQSVVDKVYRSIGDTVQIGDPLVDLFSSELADAKNDYMTKYAQWIHDYKLLEKNRKLFAKQAGAEQAVLDSETTEYKSKMDYLVAQKKLFVYGLSETDIERIGVAAISEGRSAGKEIEKGDETAKMTLRSPTSGKVIAREAARGNLYDTTSNPLLTIAPIDHLWVWVNVFESDLAKVRLGEFMEIEFPYQNEVIHGKVEYISSEVNADTHAIRVRASIPNSGNLKSDMYVRAKLEIPPVEGRTTIPRVAMIASGDEKYFVFVRVPNEKNTYARREVHPFQEKDDYVIIDHGVEAGEEVVTTGSLILSQRYEDQFVIHNGMPTTDHSRPDSSEPSDPAKTQASGSIPGGGTNDKASGRAGM